MPGLPAGSYTIASWDAWWRSAYALDVNVPASGFTPDVDLRLHATMWGHLAFWDSTAYHEFGQAFVATGPVTMIYLRSPLNNELHTDRPHQWTGWWPLGRHARPQLQRGTASDFVERSISNYCSEQGEPQQHHRRQCFLGELDDGYKSSS